MKTFRFLLLIAALGLAAGAGWFAARRTGGHVHASAGSGRTVKFYQSPMHPWIQSDQPGKCTICGMDLVPVYEGDAGAAAAEDLVTLPAGSATVSGVATSPVERGALERSLRLAGTIEDDDSRHRILPAYVEGRIEELAVPHVGAEVRAGDPLATFYSPNLLAAVREYLAYRGPGQAAAGDAGLLSAAALRLRQYGMTPEEIADLAVQPDPDRLAVPLRAPVGGTVVRRMAYPGQWVREGDPLFEIADFDVMWFQFDAYEPDLAWLRPGLEVVVTTSSRPGLQLTNRVAFIDPNLDPVTRSTRVRVELPNPWEDGDGGRRRLLPHRAYAEARVTVDVPGVLRVPRSAVLSPGGHPVAWVEVGPGAYERRDLQLGRRGDTAWEVLGGLDEGDRVVTQGGFLIDAQAQLRGGPQGGHVHEAEPVAGGSTGTPADPVTLPATPLADPTRTALDGFLAAVESARGALAADDLPGYAAAQGRMAEGATGLGAALSAQPDWVPVFQPVLAGVPSPGAGSLQEARAGFHGLTRHLIPLLVELRRTGGVPSALRIYQCPMTRTAFPGAPPKAAWFQLSGSLANPWFGAEMLECGTEVKP